MKKDHITRSYMLTLNQLHQKDEIVMRNYKRKTLARNFSQVFN